MNEFTEAATPRTSGRLGTFLDKTEKLYLRILRSAVLIIATFLILYTAYIAATGMYRMSRSPDSVKEVVANVTATEIVDAEDSTAPAVTADLQAQTDTARQKYYADFIKRYHALFRTRFEPFRQPADKTLSSDEFDDNFVQSDRRLKAATAGDTDFESDKKDLESLLATMATAAGEQRTTDRLKRYKAAKKVAVKREVRKSRTEYRQGWNSYSTDCEGWFYSPMGCRERRAVEVPYTETITTLEFPKGTQSHSQIFHAMQNKYFKLLRERRSQSAAEAEEKRTDIANGNIQGQLDIGTALRVLCAFLGLMFFFLLIAIERHQRRIAAVLPDRDQIAA